MTSIEINKNRADFTEANNIDTNLTVLMSVYNGEKFLKKSIDSVLSQSYSDFEFLIINDGSSDNSEIIIKEYSDKRIRYICNDENIGLIASLNKGIELSKGKYIARQDADDIACNKRFEMQMRFLEDNPNVSVVGSWISLIDKNDNIITHWKYPTSPIVARWALLFNSAIAHSASMFRRNEVKKINGYSSEYKYAEDFEMWSRLNKNSDICNIAEVLQLYRVHDNAVSTLKNNDQVNVMRKISFNNLNELLKNDLKPESISLLTDSKLVKNTAQARDYICSMNILFNIFSDKFELQNEKSEILNSMLEKISTLICNFNFKDRLYILVVTYNALPSIFWTRLKFINLLLSESSKKKIKKLIGIRHTDLTR